MTKAIAFLETNSRLRKMTESSKILEKCKNDFDLEEALNLLVELYLSIDEDQNKELFLRDLFWALEDDLKYSYGINNE